MQIFPLPRPIKTQFYSRFVSVMARQTLRGDVRKSLEINIPVNDKLGDAEIAIVFRDSCHSLKDHVAKCHESSKSASEGCKSEDYSRDLYKRRRSSLSGTRTGFFQGQLS
jgi:hypothetical protein